MDTPETQQCKTTHNGKSVMITLRVPHELIPAIEHFTATTGTSRTWLLIEGARKIMQQAGAIQK